MDGLLTIDQLERLAEAYFECKLTRREEEELKSVLLCDDRRSPLLDECRLAMGLELIAAVPSDAGRRSDRMSLWIRVSVVAASIALIIGIGAATFNAGYEAGRYESEGNVTVYLNGRQVTSPTRAKIIAEGEMRKSRLIMEDMDNRKRACIKEMERLMISHKTKDSGH